MSEVAPTIVCYTCKKQVASSIQVFNRLKEDGFHPQDALDALENRDDVKRACCKRTILGEIDVYGMMGSTE